MNLKSRFAIRPSTQSRIANPIKENPMKTLKALLVSASALSFVACNSQPTAPAPVADTVAPSIVSISPNNGATGVAKDVIIKVKFSEPMNQAATELAYQSGQMPGVAFSWSPDATELYIDPAGDLAYTETGKVHLFKLGSNAKDLAGNPMAEVTSSFTTFKQKTATLESVAALDGTVGSNGFVDVAATTVAIGDIPGNFTYRGFFSFDLSGLPAELQSANILSASLSAYQGLVSGTPYTDLDIGNTDLWLDHVNYGPSLNSADFDATVLRSVNELSNDAVIESKSLGVLEAVQDDWTNRADRENRSQFRLRFPLITDGDGANDAVLFVSGNAATFRPTLQIVYLVP